MDEHVKFLSGLTAYLSYGGGRSNTYPCPCSGTTRERHKGINLDLPKGARCSDNFGELGPLLGHCRNKNDVYHSGFKEYVRIMTGGAQRPTPVTGRNVDSATKGANANLGQPFPHTAWASDKRVRHK